jgi:hypothetical protein
MADHPVEPDRPADGVHHQVAAADPSASITVAVQRASPLHA